MDTAEADVLDREAEGREGTADRLPLSPAPCALYRRVSLQRHGGGVGLHAAKGTERLAGR